jgi:Leucine-rich repeat (LRR) protein
MTIFISYAHFEEDEKAAIKLYEQFKSIGQEVWLDKISISGGKDWEYEIGNAIEQSRYFVAVLSSNSVNKVGYIQKELRKAINKLDEFPPDSVYVIPVRINECRPKHLRLAQLQWIEMFPDWDYGVKRLLASIGLTRAVSFQDPYLMLAIRKNLKLAVDDITSTDAEAITSLSAQEMNITNISGIESLKNARAINLRNNKIEDISPLASLYGDANKSPNNGVYHADAISIDLANNPLTKKAIMEDIPFLQSKGIKVENILFNDENLEDTLKLIRGTVYGYQGLTQDQLSKIEEFDIGKMPVKGGEGINDLWALQLCVNLKRLFLSALPSQHISFISDLTPLKNLEELEIVSVGMPEHYFHVAHVEGNIADLSPLSTLKRLKHLNLVAQKIVDVSPLATLIALETLDLSCNHIKDAAAISGLHNLRSIKLAQNELRSIEFIEELTQLETLVVYNNRAVIDDLSPILRLYEKGALRGSVTLDPPKNGTSAEACVFTMKDMGINISLLSGYDWYATW